MATILVVEDSDEMRELLSGFISRLGHDVVEARNGLEGVKMAQSIRPALIILDLMMPVASGDFALGFVRSTESLRKTPVIVVSAHPRAPAIAEKMSAQCLPKPFSLPELKRMIEGIMAPV